MKQLSRSAHTFDFSSSSPWPSEKGESGGFERSQPVRKREALDDLPRPSLSDSSIILGTQAEQDQADEDARRKAMKDLVGSWNDRLQLISLITTFMASVEAGLLQVTSPDPDKPLLLLDVANGCLISALIIHLHASFISFVGAFFLVRFKVKEAKREEHKVEGTPGHADQPNKGSVLLDMAAKHITNSPETGSPPSTSGPNAAPAKQMASVWSANPQLVQVGPFYRQPPINLLSRCHFLCLLCAVFGFVLALCGIICLAWAIHPRGVRIVTTIVLGLCLASGLGIVCTNYDVSHFLYDSD
ncbi:hypothetical protein V5O48_010166 [Marasmius crinis-equi]|uniref:Transmembrane protein n=1 Tax=Marasmius crinis-equi TaxID=585013 RepID=A0ABR3F948_9AGAR